MDKKMITKVVYAKPGTCRTKVYVYQDIRFGSNGPLELSLSADIWYPLRGYVEVRHPKLIWGENWQDRLIAAARDALIECGYAEATRLGGLYPVS